MALVAGMTSISLPRVQISLRGVCEHFRVTEKSTADQRCRIGRNRTPLPALLLEAGTAGLLACTAAGQYARTRPSLSLALRTNVIVSNLSRDNILFSTFIQVSFYFLGKKLGGHGPPRPLPLLRHCGVKNCYSLKQHFVINFGFTLKMIN